MDAIFGFAWLGLARREERERVATAACVLLCRDMTNGSFTRIHARFHRLSGGESVRSKVYKDGGRGMDGAGLEAARFFSTSPNGAL